MTPGQGAIPFFDSSVTNAVENCTILPTRLFSYHIVNNDAVDCFLQLFNLPAASVILGTTPPTQSYVVPGGSGASNRGGLEEVLAWPLAFSVALSYAITTTATGSSAPTTPATLNLSYLSY